MNVVMLKTTETYLIWVKGSIYFHHKKHPAQIAKKNAHWQTCALQTLRHSCINYILTFYPTGYLAQ